ncbi:YtzC family protein [Bacillaceae bacterium SIJ1]|uniref:DUF2524 family protein n=1 Tax=Litoribacterium kuwaitense TaxID=1398745 RepID=UPI0013ED0C27|nr:DUF2524 family protein [Litoribacterium kuwaitense]NGP44223.1 YtzC family protein [Litoribacterium kuwaitense]
MATRASIDQWVQKANETIASAEESCSLHNREMHLRQEVDFQQAQQSLQGIVDEGEKLKDSGNAQQRETIDRMMIALRKTQQQLIMSDQL